MKCSLCVGYLARYPYEDGNDILWDFFPINDNQNFNSWCYYILIAKCGWKIFTVNLHAEIR